MDNSLQEIAGSFTFLGMNTKWIATLALALLPTAMVVPQSVASTPACIGDSCEISFSYTGDYQTWTPPEGIKDLSFEIHGAGGGRGGAGGKVAGVFTEIPETLYIFVGGVGGMGSGIEGGYNGGGLSGGNSGTEGAGGGATDIRLDLSLESRILVAGGGGGGGGGEAGGNGGHGGAEFAAPGGSGQASGGGGGAQDEGGFAGASNGGFQAGTPGQFGLGGSGGFSTFAGGGGGGGGWYGGGGGGADDNTCCSDGGGGGGGSSYANTEYVTNISHEAGVSWGHGWMTLRYTIVPTVSYFEMIQTSNERAVFSIEASDHFEGLTLEDFDLAGVGCVLGDLAVNGSIASGEVTGCLGGEVSLTLRAESFGWQTQGPPTDVVASMTFDAFAPTFEFLGDTDITSQSQMAISFNITDQLQLNTDQFAVQGCDAFTIEQSQLSLSSCSEGVAAVTLLPNTLTDTWQNSGPPEPITFSFVVDQTAPTASWSEVVVSGTNPFSYSAELEFSEPVSISNMALAFASSADCEATAEQQPTKLLVSASCSYSSLEWTFVGFVTDRAGNAMSFSALSVSKNNPSPPPAPAPAPAPIFVPVPVPVISEPVPVAPVATQSPEVSESEAVSPVTESATVSESFSEVVEVELAPRSVVVAEPAPQAIQAEPTVAAVESEPETPEVLDEVVSQEPEPQVTVSEEPVEETTQEPELAQPVLGEELPLEQPGFPWWPVALLLAIGALGVGAWRLSGR